MTDFYGELKEMRVRSIVRYVFTQPASFWLVCGYLFFEYVRPQQIYSAIDFLPWAQLTMLGSLAALVFEGRVPRIRTMAGKCLLVFVGVVLISSFAAFRPGVAFDQLELMFSWVLAFLIITAAINTPERYFIFLLLFLLASFKMSQHAARSWASAGFAFRNWGVSGAPGWFQNSGEYGIQMCVFIPLVGAFIWGLRDGWGKWKLAFFLLFPVTAMMGTIASSSRGALVGVAAVLVWLLVFVSRRFKTFIIVASVAAVAWWAVPEGSKDRFETAGDDRTSDEREVRWADAIEIMNDNPVFGVGYRNWTPYYRVHYPQRPRHGLVHNIFLEAGAELGYLGLGAFLLMIFATFRLNWMTRTLVRGPPVKDKFLYSSAFGLDGALVGFMASGFFITVLYYPYFWINLAMTVSLHLAARRRRAEVAQEIANGASASPPGSPRISGVRERAPGQVVQVRQRLAPRPGLR